MRYPAAEKLGIIRLMEQSHLPVRRTLAKLGIPPTTFYRWYDRFVEHWPEGLEDRPSSPSRVWNRIPEAVRDRVVALALEEPELSPRKLAVRFTDTEKYFVSEASVYRLLKSHDLFTSPAYIVIKAADEFKDKTSAPNQMWQTDFTYLKVIGWGRFYLSTILDDYSRYIVGWKLCGTMRAEDVTNTLDIALAASGCYSASMAHSDAVGVKPPTPSDECEPDSVTPTPPSGQAARRPRHSTRAAVRTQGRHVQKAAPHSSLLQHTGIGKATGALLPDTVHDHCPVTGLTRLTNRALVQPLSATWRKRIVPQDRLHCCMPGCIDRHRPSRGHGEGCARYPDPWGFTADLRRGRGLS